MGRGRGRGKGVRRPGFLARGPPPTQALTAGAQGGDRKKQGGRPDGSWADHNEERKGANTGADFTLDRRNAAFEEYYRAQEICPEARSRAVARAAAGRR